MPHERYDLIVLGGGSAGLTAALLGRYLGRRVLLVERNRLGGDCLNTGCVPSKTLLRSAHVAHLIRRADRFGLPQVDLPPPDLAAVMGHVQEVIHRIGEEESPEKLRPLGIEVRLDTPVFESPRVLRVGTARYEWKHCIIATGSRPAIPAIPGLAEAPYRTSDTIWDLPSLPRRLAVIGGGPVGVELAQAFARLGSEVTILGRAAQLLPRDDAEVATALRNRLQAEGITVYLKTVVERVSAASGAIALDCFVSGQARATLEADAVLVAAGRVPNVEGLGLEAAGVRRGKEGVMVDRRFRTTAPRIWACGDVTGPPRFTHVAEYQAKIVLANALFGLPMRADNRVIPWVTFTDPEVAGVGRTEEELRQREIRYKAYKVPFSQVDRAVTDDDPEGFVKILARPDGRILGAHLIGPHAGELVHELVLAMSARLSLTTIARTIHVYPTLAHGIRRAADLFLGDLLAHSWWGKMLGWLARKGRSA